MRIFLEFYLIDCIISVSSKKRSQNNVFFGNENVERKHPNFDDLVKLIGIIAALLFPLEKIIESPSN